MCINPLITNDAYMRQKIACAEVPMTHICVKDEGAHFHGIFGCCERATALSSSLPIQSPVAILWLTFRLSQVHTRCVIKRRTLLEVAQGRQASSFTNR